ncbi:hypothetical protein [Streptomyces sp. NPDC048551]|uniref:hypothetical protein n=1 Tax=Streptomyces sp. NPDC048551 TaxID=3155758 RepID=UPI0034375F60
MRVEQWSGGGVAAPGLGRADVRHLRTMEVREAPLALNEPDALFQVRHGFPKEKATWWRSGTFRSWT